jgi:hypothetical protein
MQFQILPIVAAILAATQAAPTSEPATHHLVARASRCQGSTFENQVSGGSPLIRDCEQISRNIAGSSLPSSSLSSPLSTPTNPTPYRRRYLDHGRRRRTSQNRFIRHQRLRPQGLRRRFRICHPDRQRGYHRFDL